MNPSILIVDDESSNRLLLRAILSDRYELSFAIDGASALLAAKRLLPDMILLDIMMPGIDGYETCRQLKSDPVTSKIPVIYISALNEISEKVKAFRSGGIDYINKPFHQDEVLARVGAHLKLYRLQRSLEEAQESLREINRGLEKRVAEEVEKQRIGEQMLIQQSRMASMGEMIGMIAHQWKQPLNALTLIIQDFREAFKADELNIEYINKSVKQGMNLISLMSNTIDDFRNFLKPSKERKIFDLSSAFYEVISLFADNLKKNHVSVNLNMPDNSGILINGYKNEFEQVILNLFNNSADAIKSLNRSGEITVDIKTDGARAIVSVKDNGGGIPKAVYEKLFSPYMTTKGDAGTGIGLYMSKAIIEQKMDGRIYYNNIDGGSEFIIELPIFSGDTDEH